MVQGRIDQQCLIESGRALGGQKETPVSRSQSGRRPSRATDPTAVSRATRGHQTSATTSRSRRARRGRGRGRRGQEFGEHGVGKMDETDGAIRTQTRTQDATPSTLNTTTTHTHTPSTGHRTPGPQTSSRHRPGQEDHPEVGAFCQEKEKEFRARHVGRGSAGRLYKCGSHASSAETSRSSRGMGRLGPRAKTASSTDRKRLLKKKKKQAGSGLDIQKWISKSGREWHWPGYQYMGPGTHLKKRLQRGDPGINRLDRIAKQHDIDYSRAKTLKDKHVADRKMIRAIDHLPGRKSMTEHVVKKIMQAKTRLYL